MGFRSRAARALGAFGAFNRTGTPDVPAYRPAEQRQPRAGVVPVRYTGRGMPVPAEWDGHRAILWGYYANVYVYAAVRARARARAGLPIRIGPDPDRPADHNPNHPVLAALRGNRSISARQLIAHASAQLDVIGKMGWELDQTPDGQLVSMWPLAGHLLLPILHTSSAAAARDGYFAGFEYRADGDGQGYRTLRADRTAYVWRPRQDDITQPESLLQAARLNVDVARYLDTYNAAFLRNDARPASVVITPPFEGVDEYERFKRQWNDEFGGPRNAGKPVFIEHDGETADGDADLAGALRVETLGLSQKDAQLIEQYQEQVRAITVAFSTPLSVLGDAANRTFSNAGEEHKVFWEALRADTDELAESLEQQLRPWLGSDRIWFDYSKVEALRPVSRVTAPGVRDLAAVGAIQVNEVRELAGLPPLPDGDRLAEDGSGQAPSEPLPPSDGGTVGGPGLDEETVRALFARLDDLAARVDGRATAAAGTVDTANGSPSELGKRAAETRAARDPQQRRQQATREINAIASQHETEFAQQIRDLFTRQEAATVERLTGRRGRQMLRDATIGPNAEVRVDITRVFDLAFWVDATRTVVRPLIAGPAATAAARVTALLGSPPDISSRVQEVIADRADRVAQQISETTAEQVADTLGEGVRLEEDIPTLADRLRTLFNDMTRDRAEMIARTEVIGAFNEATSAAAERFPEDLPGKEWIAADDERTRPSHDRADGQIVPAGEAFRVGAARMQFPGDPSGPAEEVIRCRCSLGYLTAEEMADEYDPDAFSGDKGERSGLRGTVPLLRAHRMIDRLAAGELAYEALSGRIAQEVGA